MHEPVSPGTVTPDDFRRIRQIFDAVFTSLAFFFLLFFLRMVLRNDALTGFVWVLLGVTLIVDWRSASVWLSAPASLALWLMIYFVLLRVGFFAFLLGRFIAGILITAPITFHASAWYADIGYSALAVLAIIAVYGFWASLAGQPALAFGGDGKMPTTS